MKPKPKHPKWAKWIARDADGRVFVFEHRPIRCAYHWMAWTGDMDIESEASDAWKRSLRPITPARTGKRGNATKKGRRKL